MTVEDNNTFQSDETPTSSTEEALGALSGGDTSFVVEEQKKPLSRSTVLMFAALALGGAGLWYMHSRTGPATAAAASSKEAKEADKTINQFLQGGENNIKSMETMLRDTEKVVQQFRAYPSMTQIPLSQLKTNPFRHGSAADTGDGEDLATKRRREQELEVATRAVESLRLQSIMAGSARKACMIDNTMYAEGQQVEGFTIEKITPTSVILNNGTYRFEKKMAQK